MTFSPTHMLVSRSKRIPVQLLSSNTGYLVVTEKEWNTGHKPAFELHPKLGLFCLGVAVIGYDLEPIESQTEQTPAASEREQSITIPTAACA